MGPKLGCHRGAWVGSLRSRRRKEDTVIARLPAEARPPVSTEVKRKLDLQVLLQRDQEDCAVGDEAHAPFGGRASTAGRRSAAGRSYTGIGLGRWRSGLAWECQRGICHAKADSFGDRPSPGRRVARSQGDRHPCPQGLGTSPGSRPSAGRSARCARASPSDVGTEVLSITGAPGTPLSLRVRWGPALRGPPRTTVHIVPAEARL